MISGRYALEDRLGSGGMSNVYRGTDRVLERTVAVKLLAEHLSDDEKFVARFRREALAVAKLVHPNIVQVYDTGVDAGRHYIVMEYVEGHSGAQILHRLGSLDPDTVVDIGVQACAGLDHAHRQGIIHRDVKPGNLMVIGGPTTDGDEMSVKLADFGIARATEQTRLTQAGSVVGTAAYLSPEQSRGEEATPGSDVYALGVVTYQLLTGRLPYEGSSLAELAIRRENERPLPPTAYNRDVPDALSAVVLRSLEADPLDRYTDARGFSEGLLDGQAGRGPAETEATRVMGISGPADPPTEATRRIQTTPLPPLPTPRSDPRTPPRGVITPSKRRGRRNWGRIFAVLLLICLIAALIAAVVLLATDPKGEISRVIADTVQHQIDGIRKLIEQHTQGR